MIADENISVRLLSDEHKVSKDTICDILTIHLKSLISLCYMHEMTNENCQDNIKTSQKN